MTHAWTLFRLAMLELWTSYRLLAALAVMLASGGLALVAAEVADPASMPGGVPGRPPVGAWFGLALALAVAVVAALVAGALAGERRRGFSGWLVSRSAPRATLVVAWFGAGALVILAGGAISAIVAWLAVISRGTASPDAAASFAAAAASCLAAAMAAVALGVLAGVTLVPALATLAAGTATAAWLIGMALAVPVAAYVPGGGFVTMATSHLAAQPVAVSLGSAGVSLALAAAMLVLAQVAFARIDL